jgi:hypothetical protein
MLAVLAAVTFVGFQTCAETLLRDATTRVQAFDLAGAVAKLGDHGSVACPDVALAAIYLRGLAAAFEAYKQGGSEESLVAVREAIGELETMSGQRPGRPEVARLVLIAAAAAAQSEREEMGAFLTHALAMESLQFAAGQPGAPVLTAHEIAGELWLQVHRFDEARAAFARAAKQVGTTPRITAGLARATPR